MTTSPSGQASGAEPAFSCPLTIPAGSLTFSYHFYSDAAWSGNWGVNGVNQGTGPTGFDTFGPGIAGTGTACGQANRNEFPPLSASLGCGLIFWQYNSAVQSNNMRWQLTLCDGCTGVVGTANSDWQDTFNVVFAVSGNSPILTGMTLVGCAAKSSTTTTLTNGNTYFALGTAVNPVTITNITLWFSSQATATTNIILGLYVTKFPTSTTSVIGSTNPLVRQSSQTFSVPAGAAAGKLGYNPSFTIAAGFQFAVAASTSAGTTTVNTATSAGTYTMNVDSVDGATPANIITFTTGTPAICLFGSGPINQLITQTTTSGATASTTTITSIDINAAVSTTTGYSLLLLVILGPAMVMAVGIGMATKNGVASAIAFVAGLMIGAGIGNQVGLVPFWLVALLVFSGIFIMVGIWRLGASGAGG